MFNRLCGSIGYYASYSIDKKKFFVLFLPFCPNRYGSSFKKTQLEIAAQANFIYVY